MNTYYLSSDLSYHKAYKIPLSISFAQTPKASLGNRCLMQEFIAFSTIHLIFLHLILI
jgi:hypothetical protein